MAKTPWHNRITRYGESAPDQLLANPLNFRMHPKHQQDALAGVLSEIGVVQNVIVNERTGHVVDGHLRISLAMRDGIPTIPVTYVDLSPAEEATILATLDPISALATADAEKLRELLDEVSTSDAAVMQMLSDLAEREGILDPQGTEGLTDPDDVPEPPADPITRPGDLWTLGRHRLLCGDSTVEADVRTLMDGETADMVFTDPPYGVDYQGGHFHSGDVNIVRKRERLANDQVNIYADVLPIIARVVDGPCYVWFASTLGEPVYSGLVQNGFEIHALIVWHKINATYAAMNAQYKQRHECCIYAKPKGSTLRWVGPTDECTVWEIKRDGVNNFHPTQKPVALAERAIGNHDVQLVLDLFGGSGSTLIACESTGRRCAMMELDPAYVDVIVARWEAFTGQTATRTPALHAEAAD